VTARGSTSRRHGHVRTIVDPAADFVPACERVFGRPVRVLDGSRAVLLDDVKLTLEAGERELWLVRMHATALEEWLAMVDVEGDIEGALRRARELLDA
jgi:hypothetical protein